MEARTIENEIPVLDYHAPIPAKSKPASLLVMETILVLSLFGGVIGIPLFMASDAIHASVWVTVCIVAIYLIVLTIIAWRIQAWLAKS
jgi:hypothetical protein